MSLITFSSSIGCLSNEIAYKVSRETNLELFDNEKIEDEAHKLNKLIKIKKSNKFENLNFLNKFLFRNPEFYYEFIENIVDEISKNGKAIVSGYASHIFLRDFNCDLKIYVYAPIEFRILNIMKKNKLNKESSEKIIKYNDIRKRDFFRYIFKNENITENLYDLVINSSKINIDHAAELIINTIRSNSIKKISNQIIKGFKKISLEKRISSLLAFNNLNLNNLKINVDEEGFAEINGFINNKNEKKIIENVIKKIGGILKIKTKLKIK